MRDRAFDHQPVLASDPRALIRDGVLMTGPTSALRVLSGARVWPGVFLTTAGSVTRPAFELLAPRSTSLAGHEAPAAVIAEIRAWSAFAGAGHAAWQPATRRGDKASPSIRT